MAIWFFLLFYGSFASLFNVTKTVCKVQFGLMFCYWSHGSVYNSNTNNCSNNIFVFVVDILLEFEKSLFLKVPDYPSHENKRKENRTYSFRPLYLVSIFMVYLRSDHAIPSWVCIMQFVPFFVLQSYNMNILYLYIYGNKILTKF